MGSEWPLLTLEEAGVTLIDCVHKTPVAAEDGIPYIAIPQMRDGRIDTAEARLVGPGDVAEWNRKANPEPYDVMLSRRCNPGETVFVPPSLPCVVGQNLVLLRSDGTRVYPPFLRWLVRGPAWEQQVRRHLNVGAVFDSLRCADIPSLRLPIPPLEEQRRIASILGALDDKIELNRCMSRTLDEMAQAIFRSWFVETPAGSERTDLPEGWTWGTLGSVVELRNERTRPDDQTRAMPYVPLECLASKTLVLRVFRPGEEALSSLTRFHRGDVLFGAYRPYFHKVNVMPFDGTTRTTAFVLRARSHADRAFAALRLFQDETVEYATSHSEGTTIPYARWKDSLEEMRIAVPPRSLRARFGDVAWPLIERQFSLVGQTRVIEELRNSLLPRLLSGELAPGG